MLMWWFRRRPKESPSRERLLRGVPVRNEAAEWRESEGKTRISIPRTATWKSRALSLLFHVPKEHIIELDEVGDEVVRMCNGTNTVKEIARRLAKKRKLDEREAEAALLQYLQTLVKRGVVGIAISGGRKKKTKGTKRT
jgi:hypothetical protein